MARRFKKGDRVKLSVKALKRLKELEAVGIYVFSGEKEKVVGTVVGSVGGGSVLVKFDNFTNGHDGFCYYIRKGKKGAEEYDPKNKQHLFAEESMLCLVDKKEKKVW